MNTLQKKKKYVFHLLDGDCITSKNLRFIVDPKQDSIFKYIFGMEAPKKD